MSVSFVDIHCHLLPGIDDGAKSWDDALAMARLAVDDGTTTIIATPHQLGNFGHNRGGEICHLVDELQRRLDDACVPLRVLPGADVRIEPEMVERIPSGEVLTLGDHRCHVLLELPHELYFPVEPVLAELRRRKLVGILSHPERNEGILRQPDVLAPLVDAGCLMQITAGSLCGSFGSICQEFAEWMLQERLVHFVATDAHGTRSRRPLMRRAFERTCELTDEEIAIDLCSRNPGRVADGAAVPGGRPNAARRNEACRNAVRRNAVRRNAAHRERRWWARQQVA
jgi:protein-tyrosine phosphatase